MHAREEHVLGIDVVVLVGDDEVGVLLVGRFLFLAGVDGRPFLADGLAHVALLLQFHLSRIGLTVEQRPVAILLAAQVAAQREDVFGRVLVHRRVGRRADDDEGVARIADHDHEKAQQRRVLDA